MREIKVFEEFIGAPEWFDFIWNFQKNLKAAMKSEKNQAEF
jgi:hypothetical protein